MRGLSVAMGALLALAFAACGGSRSATTPSADGGAGAPAGGAAGAAGAGGTAGSSSGGASGASGAGGTTTAPGCSVKPLAAGSTQTIQIQHDGMQRSYILHVPKGYDGSKPVPLVLNFHGHGSNAVQQEYFSLMDGTSDADGFIVAYPEGINGSWNAGVCCQFTGPTTDDVGFARAVVTDIESRTCIDDKRVYSTGMSNGGYLSHLLACKAADVFTAIAPVAGVLGIPPSQCNPSRPVPVIEFHGIADPIVPYNGGDTLGSPSVPDTFKGWAARDGCTGSPVQTFQNGKATCMTYEQCSAGVKVTLCSIQDEGHCWPGTAFCPPTLGTPNTDISANNEMWKFFTQYALP